MWVLISCSFSSPPATAPMPICGAPRTDAGEVLTPLCAAQVSIACRVKASNYPRRDTS